MSDTYQAIYDAVRSKISGGNISDAVTEAIRYSCDISHAVAIVKEEIITAAHEYQRPFVLLRPRMLPDGNQWCALYGENLHDGIAGFGNTPALAAADFDRAWRNESRKDAPK